MLPFTWLEEAKQRLASHCVITPVTYDAELDLYLKWENQQVTGSFKARGAINKVLTLEAWERERVLVTASAGNHGQGLALAGRLAGARVTIFASEHAPAVKISAMRAQGAEVRLTSGGYAEAEQAGLAFAAEQGATWVSAYNDGQVIAGQGTVGLEAQQQVNINDGMTWLAPVGGGGLISGIAAAVKSNGQSHGARVVGVQSEASPFFYALYHRGSQDGVEDLPTLADGLAGAVESGSLTIALVRRLVDDMILVSEAEIVRGIVYAWQKHGQRIEGSGAVGLAAVLSGKIEPRPALAIVSGGNIQPELHARIIAETGLSGLLKPDGSMRSDN
jgi:threonine dehydratase